MWEGLTFQTVWFSNSSKNRYLLRMSWFRKWCIQITHVRFHTSALILNVFELVFSYPGRSTYTVI
jgi:hypothetical protein